MLFDLLKEKKSNILTFQKRTCLGEKKRKKAEEKQKKTETALTHHSLKDLRLEEGKRKAGELMRHDIHSKHKT